MRLLSLVVFILISIESFSQSYLNDSTRFGGVGSTISSVFEVDTGYYLAAGRFSIEHGNTSEIVLGYIDDAGFSSVVVDFDTLNNQWVYSSVSKLVQNERGNFVIRYKNCDTVSCYPRVKEYTPEGVLVADVNFRELLDSLNVGVLDFGDFIQKKDSTYVLLANTSYPSIGTALYIHLDENFNIIDAIHFIHPHVDWQYGSSNVIELPDGNTAIAISEVKFLNDIEGGVKMVIVDENDEVVKECFYIY